MAGSETMREALEKCVAEFDELYRQGSLDLSTEATARSWIEELLRVFGWDPLNPQQVDQEIHLSPEARAHLEEIDSHHNRPDYLLCNGTRPFIYIDAKKIGEKISENKKAAFQVRSYGWSAGHPCVVVTNFRELAIYDCRFKPHQDDPVEVARAHYFDYTKYEENFETLSEHFERSRVMDSELSDLYKDYAPPKGSKPLDIDFSEHIRGWRLKFANSILKNDRKASIEKISNVTQVIIDRLIFLRVCEGLRIEGDMRLKALSKGEGKDAWRKMRKFFSEHCLDRYGGALFQDNHLLDDVELDFSLIREFVNTLYYPFPYRFDVITPNLLGNIYERYLGRKLVKKEGSITDEFKEEYQKTKGAVYTPAYIVNHICDSTLAPILSSKSFAASVTLKICDPACGSGSFLLGAFDYLATNLSERFLSESPRTQKQFKNWIWTNPRNGRAYLKTGAKKKLLNDCIFGMDIDPQAVEIGRLSLSLKALENLSLEPEMYGELGLLERGILKGVGKNIRLGNAIVDDSIFDRQQSLRSDVHQLVKLKPFNWKSDPIFGPVFQSQGGFDAIIGNPPYIEVKHYKKDLPAMHAYLADASKGRPYFSCGNGKTDIAMPFIEKGLQLLRDGGRLGFIVQNRFFKAQYGENSRSMLSSSGAIEEIIDFGSLRIFPGRTTYTCILILSKATSGKKLKFFRLETHSKLEKQLRDPLRYGINVYSLPNSLGEAPWIFAPPDLAALRDKLKATFGSISEHQDLSVGVGLQVLFKKVYYIKGRRRGAFVVGSNLLGQEVQIEADIVRPLVANRGFYAFKKLVEDSFVLFPYEIVAKKGEIEASAISEKELKSKFPAAYEYLKSNEALIKKSVETKSGSSWFLYMYEKNLISQSLSKVLVPSTLIDLCSTVDNGQGFYQDNVRVNCIQVEEAKESHYKAISAVVNSRIFDCLAKITAERLDNGYFQMNRQFLEPVPFPLREVMSKRTVRERLEALYDELSERSEEFAHSDHEETRTAARAALQAAQQALDSYVEESVYSISAKEAGIVRKYSKKLGFDKLMELGIEDDSSDDQELES